MAHIGILLIFKYGFEKYICMLPPYIYFSNVNAIINFLSLCIVSDRGLCNCNYFHEGAWEIYQHWNGIFEPLLGNRIGIGLEEARKRKVWNLVSTNTGHSETGSHSKSAHHLKTVSIIKLFTILMNITAILFVRKLKVIMLDFLFFSKHKRFLKNVHTESWVIYLNFLQKDFPQ